MVGREREREKKSECMMYITFRIACVVREKNRPKKKKGENRKMMME